MLSVVVLGVSVTPAMGAVVISWSNPSVSINTINSTTVQVTGNTQGDVITPFLIEISTVSANLDVTLSELGAINPSLNMNMPTTRNASSLMTVRVSVPNFQIVSPSFSFLDLDIAPGIGSPGNDEESWEDQVLMPASGVTATSVNNDFTSVALINGNTVLRIRGIDGNVDDDENDSNVNISMTGTRDFFQYVYGPGPQDGFAGNQRHGMSNITFTSIISAVPEPGTWAMLGLVGVGGAWFARRRMRQATVSRELH